MLDGATKAKLRDPAYLDLHLAAGSAIRKLGIPQCYDSSFIRRFAVVRFFVSQVRPDAIKRFVRGCDPLLPPPGPSISRTPFRAVKVRTSSTAKTA